MEKDCCAGRISSSSSAGGPATLTCCDHQPGMTHQSAETPSTTCCGNSSAKSNNDTPADLCLAVIHENGTDVVLFDRAGVPRTFQYQGSRLSGKSGHSDGSNENNSTSTATQPQSKEQQPLLCFQNHGSAQYDDWLTPCLDEEGRHGAPEESCFCGVETPHLHAHVKDPKTCSQEAAQKEQDIGKLASHILLPTNNDLEAEVMGGLHMPVTKQMPQECNFSQTLLSSQNEHGHHQPHPAQRRLHKVQHGDHVDYLVHNAATGNLHLEHASCNDCGNNDIHGRFDAVGERLLPNKNVHIHFYQVAAKPFNILDCLADLFLIESDARVSAVECIMGPPDHHGHEHGHGHHHGPSINDKNASLPDAQQPQASSSVVVRSTFVCNGICCASEIPLIEGVLKPVPGVREIRINVPLKQVIVDHNVHQISATRIAQTLQGFGSTVVSRDGGLSLEPPTDTTPTTTKGRSQFFVQHICCASEIPAVRSIVEPLAGVTAVSINTTTKLVYVDHDTALTTAQTICDRLNDEHFGAQLRLDAAVTLAGRGMAWVQSEFVVIVAPTSQETPVSVESILTTDLQKWQDTGHVEQFQLDMGTGRLTVKHNPFRLTATQLAQELSQQQQLEEGMPPTMLLSIEVTWDGSDPAVWDYPYQLQHARTASGGGDAKSATIKGATYPRPTVLISGILWIVSMLSLIGGNWEHLKWVALVSVAFGIPPIALKAFRTLRRYQFDTNCLMFFASVGAIALQDFEEAAAVVFLFALSEWLEVRATSRARQALAAIVDLRPETACLVHPFTQELLTIPATAVPLGALVSVKTGDKIPCDGVVVDGVSTVDESSLTGESRPIRKGPKDKVSGGTVNSGLSPLMVQTTSTSDDSAVARLIRLVEEAQANRSETEKLVDEFAKIYTPIVVLSALLMCSISWAFGPEAGRQWTRNGLILIVVACPCALVISTPVSYVAGLAATAQKGILIKGGATLEALGAVKHICFDKTGTLTNGEFALLHMEVLTEALSREEIFQYLALMEERASHPVAQAILAAANNEKVVLPKNMTLQKHAIINGEGVVGVIGGHEVHVGNERLFERLGLLASISDKNREMVDEWKNLGGTIGYMSIGDYGIVCAYCAADGIREESALVVKRLRKMGISITMLTGDNFDAALAIGKQVGLPPGDIKAKLLPEEKLQFVESLSQGNSQSSIIRSLWKRKQLVMHCGDGVNDAPALAAAHVGVAMGEGAALSMETADVTLLDSDLQKIEFSIRMGQKVTSKIIQNVVFSLAVKFLVLGFALAGMADLWAAIASDVGAMLLVTINAMLLLPKKQPRKDVSGQSDIEESKPGTASSVRVARGGSASSTKPVETKTCAKGCCGSSSPGNVNKVSTHSHDHNHLRSPIAGSQSPDVRDKDAGSKGCCGSSHTKQAAHTLSKSHSHDHNHRQPTIAGNPVVPTKDAGSKGCCSSSSTISKEKHAEHKHGRSHSHDHNHCQPKIAGSPAEPSNNAGPKGCCSASSIKKTKDAGHAHSPSHSHSHHHHSQN